MLRHPRTTARPRRIWHLLAATVLLSLPACGDEAPSRDAEGLAGPDRPASVSLDTLWEIGGASAPEWAAFSEVKGLGFDDAGRLHVLDGQAGRVTVLGPGGSFERGYGSPGRGPGEMSAPGPFVVRPDGSGAVFDYAHRAWLLYDSVGAFAGDVPVSEGSPGTPAMLHPEGWVVAAVLGGGDEEAPPSRPVARYPLSGDPPSVLFRAWDLPPAPPPVIDAVTLGGRTLRVGIPRERAFEPGLHLAVLPGGGIAVADSFAWKIRILDASGAPTGTLARPLEPAPATEEVREAERRRRLREVADGQLPGFMISGSDGSMSPADRASVRQFMEARLENMVFGEAVPVIEGLAADRDGILWVQRSSGEPGVAGPTDLVGPDGTYLGTLPPDGPRTPAAFGPDGLAAWVLTDDLGVPRLLVGRLAAPTLSLR